MYFVAFPYDHHHVVRIRVYLHVNCRPRTMHNNRRWFRSKQHLIPSVAVAKAWRESVKVSIPIYAIRPLIHP
jgi:hypothetical protein